MSTHVFSLILRGSTVSVPGKKALKALVLPKPRSLLALTVTMFSWGKIVLRSAAHCSAIHRLASMPPISKSVAAQNDYNYEYNCECNNDIENDYNYEYNCECNNDIENDYNYEYNCECNNDIENEYNYEYNCECNNDIENEYNYDVTSYSIFLQIITIFYSCMINQNRHGMVKRKRWTL